MANKQKKKWQTAKPRAQMNNIKIHLKEQKKKTAIEAS